MGMPEEELAARRAEAREAAARDLLEVWPENWRPLLLAIAMQTQVRMTMARPVGFDYTALPVVEARIGMAPPQDETERADEFIAFRQIEKIMFAGD